MGYGGKVAERLRARALRAEGWTYDEIAAELAVSKSSVSLWCRDVEVRPEKRRARRHPPVRTEPNALQRRKADEIEHLRVQAVEWLGDLTARDLFVAGIALYAGEGSKTDGSVRFANSDPRMIALFLRWFRTFFEVDESRLRVKLYLHADQDLDEANRFWSTLTGIGLERFPKPYRAVVDRSIRLTKHPLGCPCIVYHSSSAHRSVMGLVRALLSSEEINPG